MEIKWDEYPYLQDRDNAIPYPEPGDTILSCVPKGWQKLFMKYMDCINELFIENDVRRGAFHFDQVKEKFGSLRIYWHVEYDCADEMTVDRLQDGCSALIDDLETESGSICVECGEPATLQSTGWVLPYCRACAERLNAAANERHKTNYTVEQTYNSL